MICPYCDQKMAEPSERERVCETVDCPYIVNEGDSRFYIEDIVQYVKDERAEWTMEGEMGK